MRGVFGFETGGPSARVERDAVDRISGRSSGAGWDARVGGGEERVPDERRLHHRDAARRDRQHRRHDVSEIVRCRVGDADRLEDVVEALAIEDPRRPGQRRRVGVRQRPQGEEDENGKQARETSTAGHARLHLVQWTRPVATSREARPAAMAA
jgi:hypothetical protein